MTANADTRRYGTFSYLPPLTKEEIGKQIDYILGQSLVSAIEFTPDPGPDNVFWSMWKLPLFDVETAAAILQEIEACARAPGQLHQAQRLRSGPASPGGQLRRPSPRLICPATRQPCILDFGGPMA